MKKARADFRPALVPLVLFGFRRAAGCHEQHPARAVADQQARGAEDVARAVEDEPEVARKRRAVKRSGATVTDRPGPPKKKPSKAAAKGGKKAGGKK